MRRDVTGVNPAAIPGIVLVAILTLVTGCSSTVAGSGSGTDVVATTTTAEAEPTMTTESEPTAETESEPTAEPTAVSLPTIDEGAPAQYCTDPFPGALGEPMLAVVVETPSGRLTCDQAAAVLFDYYAQRPDPTLEQPPLTIGSMTCDQVPEPALPQVVCVDEDNLIYSMWPQT